MGMFDYYKTKITCPVCGSDELWQGKSGPCGLYLYEQGNSKVIRKEEDNHIEEWFKPPPGILPQSGWYIHNYCSCGNDTSAELVVINDIWVDLINIETIHA